MRYFLIKQIHITCAAVSSGDLFITKEVSPATFALGSEPTFAQKCGIAWAYDEPDMTFYNIKAPMRQASIDEVNAHFETHYAPQGWTIDNQELRAAQQALWQEQENAETQDRSAAGAVFPSYEHKQAMTPEQYQGGFSDEVFNNPDLAKYVRSGLVFGYIGHYERHPETDTFFERLFLAVENDPSLLAWFLSSRSGRHFADQLDVMNVRQSKQTIAENILQLVEDAKTSRALEA